MPPSLRARNGLATWFPLMHPIMTPILLYICTKTRIFLDRLTALNQLLDKQFRTIHLVFQKRENFLSAPIPYSTLREGYAPLSQMLL